MAEIPSGSSRAPENRKVANARARGDLRGLEYLVVDVAKSIAVLIRYGTIIPDNDLIGPLKPLGLLYPM
jgi:hypothetical protein